MLTDDSPVRTSSVPLPSVAKVLTTQVEGKPLTGTGGPKKQVGSKAQAPRSPGAVGVARALDRRVVDAVLGRLRARGAVRAAGAEAGDQVHAVRRLEDRGRILRNERRRLVGGAATDVQAAETELQDRRRAARVRGQLAREGSEPDSRVDLIRLLAVRAHHGGEAQVGAERRRLSGGRGGRRRRGRARGRHGQPARQGLGEDIDRRLDRAKLVRSAAALERAVEGRPGLRAAGRIRRVPGARRLGPALRDGLGLLADRAHLLGGADVRARRAVADDLQGAGDHVVDGGLERGRVEIVTVAAADEAIALVARLR